MELKTDVINENIKKTRGRPKGSFKKDKLTDNKDYHNNYYLKTCGDVICECGLKTNKRNLSRHKKSKKHLEILEIKLNRELS